MNQEFQQTYKLINKLIRFVGGWSIDNEQREARGVGGKGRSKKLEKKSDVVQGKWASAHSFRLPTKLILTDSIFLILGDSACKTRNMIAAIRFHLPTFMNNMEENSIEIEIGNRRSKLSTGPVFVKLTAEADKHDKENNLSSSEDHFVFIRDLESLLNENSWKYNET